MLVPVPVLVLLLMPTEVVVVVMVLMMMGLGGQGGVAIAGAFALGRMDQACAYGSVPVVMKFKGAQLDVEDAKLAGEAQLLPSFA
eukprot:1158678-Pelagomonas_calceolata.AAC.1